MTTYRVNVYRTYFLEDEISDGDYYSAPNTHVVSDLFIGHASELARWIRELGLSFSASGGDWASDPDGSYVTNYATGQRCEVSAHFMDEIPERLANAIRVAVDTCESRFAGMRCQRDAFHAGDHSVSWH